MLDGREVKYEVLQTSQLSVKGKPWTAMVIKFPDLEMTRTTLDQVLSGGKCSSAQAPVLIVASDDGSEAYSTVIDKNIAQSERVTALEHGDFMGSGSELSLSFVGHFCDPATPEHSMVDRRYIFGFPKLEALAALDAVLRVTTPDSKAKATNQINVVTTRDGKRGIVYQREGEAKPLFLNLDAPIEQRVGRPNTQRVKAVIPLSTEQSPATFRGRVVNEQGRPISGVKVDFETRRTGLWVVLGKLDHGSAITDKDGRFDAPTGEGLTIVIEDERFQNLREDFHPAKYNIILEGMGTKPVKDEVTDLVLLDKNAKVEVWDTGPRIVKRLGARPDDSELGIKFYPTREENKSNPLEVTALADIVFEFRKLCEPGSEAAETGTCPWEVIVRGQHGWELVPTEPYSGYYMPRAAETGYEPIWTFDHKSLPRSFYLRKDEGERYGVLGNLSYSNFQSEEWKFGCSFYVQAKPEGTRSLVHERRPYVEPRVLKPREQATPTPEATGKTP